MILTAVILPFFASKLIFSKITEGKFSFRAIDTLIIYDGKGEFISFMMSGAVLKGFAATCQKSGRLARQNFKSSL